MLGEVLTVPVLLRIGRRAAEEGELEAPKPWWCVCGVSFGEEPFVVVLLGVFSHTLLRPVVSVFNIKVVWGKVEAGNVVYSR